MKLFYFWVNVAKENGKFIKTHLRLDGISDQCGTHSFYQNRTKFCRYFSVALKSQADIRFILTYDSLSTYKREIFPKKIVPVNIFFLIQQLFRVSSPLSNSF